eukprot:13305508-Alexandrium_andersonii.AAC.1
MCIRDRGGSCERPGAPRLAWRASAERARPEVPAVGFGRARCWSGPDSCAAPAREVAAASPDGGNRTSW